MKKLITLLISFFISISIVNAEEINVKFSRCIDGDTAAFYYNNKEITVRMLAIDTPETNHPTKGKEPYGEEASNYTCYKLMKAKRIKLEYDDNSDKFDKYDRHLAWIFVDNSLLQQDLIKKGYAKVDYVYGDYKYLNILKEEEKNAKLNQIGIWNNNKNIMNYILFDDGSINYFTLSIIMIIIIIGYFTSKKFRRKLLRKIK